MFTRKRELGGRIVRKQENYGNVKSGNEPGTSQKGGEKLPRSQHCRGQMRKEGLTKGEALTRY